ncbi:NAD(P)/FAD-dependent oxidoreductase [Solimonas sp. SE-A11]|uniref:flavin-containing monooxygenase n=1 Tax=Solimonas sp. SE-A11 TaxID=3054954 RepID=UPI00259CAD3D|nr:NAD(P)/FAD-dependent oxidoreductase [Solimonas sp. SE-A11]
MQDNHYDVLIIGAGLSGIGAACHLARELPQKRVGILERRQAIGGTWDLFRYPGIRSDTDMLSFGYDFRPRNKLQVMGDGPAIRGYVNETAREYGVDRKVRFGVQTTRAEWSSADGLWKITGREEGSGRPLTFTTKVLLSCTGYYNYDQGYLPQFAGLENFRGQCIHPQHWPEGLDYRGKRVVVIGSGATAVTLVPAMAAEAGHVTMLQRSPSYIFSLPAHDTLTEMLVKLLPERWAFGIARRRNIFLQRLIYKAAKRWPDKVRGWLLDGVRKNLGPDADMRHFTPSYEPWDERLCAVPDADLFKAIRAGKASVVTDHIETFTEKGIRLKSGQELEADIVITATGLQMQVGGGMEFLMDGKPLLINQQLTYKGVLVEGVPNLAWIFGYTNAPWTLKADIAAAYVCRLLKHMEAQGVDVVTPQAPAGQKLDESIMGALQSGYVQRGNGVLPRQGRDLPWRVLNHYERDRVMLLQDPVADTALAFRKIAPVARAA